MAFSMHIPGGQRSATSEPEVVIVAGRRTTALLIEAAALANMLAFREPQRGRGAPDEVRVVRATGWHDAVRVASRCPHCVLVTDNPENFPASMMDSEGRRVRVLSVEDAFGENRMVRHSAGGVADKPADGILTRLIGRWLPDERVNARG